MIKIEDAVLIVYPPGGYGHYIFWILENFTSLGTGNIRTYPFDTFGGSHNKNQSKITRPKTIPDLIEHSNRFHHSHLYIHNDNDLELVRIISEKFKKYIVIVNNDKKLQLMNNLFDKAKKKDLEVYVRSIKNCEDFELSNEKFINREYLSYKAFTNINWVSLDQFPKDSISLNIEDLLYNFKFFISELMNFLGTELIEPEFVYASHDVFISLQRHLHKDQDVKKFLDCFQSKFDCDLPKDLSIIDEAYIQHVLRNEFDLEIECNNLNEFPKTTSELRKITYPAKELERFE